MYGGVWERVSASFAQHSREEQGKPCDTECNACKPMPHNYSGIHFKEMTQCCVYSL